MISLELFSALKKGDKVEIVHSWPPEKLAWENGEGLMDHWLGAVMTIDNCNETRASMTEDGGRWAWNRWCIRRVLNKIPIGVDELI